MSLVEELQQKTVSPLSRKSLGIGLGIVLIIGLSLYFYSSVFGKDTSAVESVSTTEYTVKRGDITIGSKADGTVQGNSSTTLGFEVNGRIKQVFKHIGDSVTPGEAIAQIDDQQLRLDVQKAQNSLTQSELSYSKNMNPLSSAQREQLAKDLEIGELSHDQQVLKLQNDIISNEQSITTAKQKLAQLEDNLNDLSTDNSLTLKQATEDQNLTQKQKDLYNQLFDSLQKLKDLDLEADKFMGFSAENSPLNDSFETIISNKNTSLKYKAEDLRSKLHAGISAYSVTPYTSEDELVKQSNVLLEVTAVAKQLASVMLDVLNNTAGGGDLTNTRIDSYKSTFNSLLLSASSQEKSIRNGIDALASAKLSSASSLDNAADSLQDKTTSLQQQIENAKQDLVFAMQQYELKKVELAQTKQSNDKNLEKTKLDNSIKSNPLTTQEKQLYAAQAASARLSYQEKLNDLKKATLTSPVSGVILTVNGNVGEQSSADFVTIGTNGYKYVVVSIDEDEIGMIQAGQQARITPSAIDDLTITGTVYYIANAGTTDNNGVVTFQAFVSFYTDDPRLKTAMNVEVEFIKKTVENVLIVPIKAVFPYENSPHVKLIDGTLRKVITGLSDGKQVEVISGLTEGEKILITQ